MAENKYVVVKQVTLPCVVTIQKNKETGQEYLSYVLKAGKYPVRLQPRAYNETETEVVKEVVNNSK